MRKMQIWMFQKILRFSTFWTPAPSNEKDTDLDVSEDFKVFNFSAPSPPKMRKMQIWMFQKIFNFLDPPWENADLDVSEDF